MTKPQVGTSEKSALGVLENEHVKELASKTWVTEVVIQSIQRRVPNVTRISFQHFSKDLTHSLLRGSLMALIGKQLEGESYPRAPHGKSDKRLGKAGGDR